MTTRGDKRGKSLRELMEIADLPLSCTIGDWLRRMGENGRGLSGLGKVNHHLVREVVLRDKRNRGAGHLHAEQTFRKCGSVCLC